MMSSRPEIPLALGQGAAVSLEMNDRGLIAGNGCRLVRMRKTASDRFELALDTDHDRLIAMVSIAQDRPVRESELLPHIEAAARHWQSGDKALANCRLIVSPLAKIFGPEAAYRLSLAGRLLDAGWAPHTLLVELGLSPFGKNYNPSEPRRSAHTGHGGEWTVGLPTPSVPVSDGRFIVAIEPHEHGGDEDEKDKDYKLRFLIGVETPADDIAHGRPFQVPVGVGPGPFAGRSIPAGPSARPSDIQKQKITEIGRDTGCHTCGRKDPNTANGLFVCDHQPSTALNSADNPQIYLPHCRSCSTRQGGLIKGFKARSRKVTP